MGVSAFAVDAASREAHEAEDFALTDWLSGLDRDGREVSVKRVERAAVPKVLDNNVSPVVRSTRVPAQVDDVSAGGRSYFVAGVPECVSADRTNVDSLMELKVQNLAGIANRPTDKTELTTLPRLRPRPLEIAVYIHVEVLRTSLEQSAIVGRKFN